MKKILFLMPSLGSGGAERVVFNLLNGLSALNLKLTLVNLFSDGFLSKKLPGNVQVITLGFKRLIISIPTLLRLVKSDENIIFASGYHNVLLALVGYLTGHSHKIILRETSVVGSTDAKWKRGFLLSAIMPVLYKSTRGVIFQSEYGKKDFEYFFNFKLQNSAVLLNPSFQLPKTPNEFSGKNIFLVGTINFNKNQRFALEQINISGLKDVTVEIFGDGPEKINLENFVKSTDLGFKVIFHGKVSNMDEQWHRAGLHVLTSGHESFPNVVIEAAMSGVPSVCLDSPGGLNELFQLGEWGRLTTSVQLANAIRDTYHWGFEKRSDIASKAKLIFNQKAMSDYKDFFCSKVNDE